MAQKSPEPEKVWEIRAAEFGNHTRQGGWRLAWLVASCCEFDKGHGQSTDETTTSGSLQKVSLVQFAEKAGVGRETVRLYFKAWELAADQSFVDHATDLDQADEYCPLEDVDMPEWKDYYRKAKGIVEEPTPQKDSKAKEEATETDAPTISPEEQLIKIISESEEKAKKDDRKNKLSEWFNSVERVLDKLKDFGEPQNPTEIKVMNKIAEKAEELFKIAKVAVGTKQAEMEANSEVSEEVSD